MAQTRSHEIVGKEINSNRFIFLKKTSAVFINLNCHNFVDFLLLILGMPKANINWHLSQYD